MLLSIRRRLFSRSGSCRTPRLLPGSLLLSGTSKNSSRQVATNLTRWPHAVMGGWSERVMGQKGFFDVERRLEAISALGDPLETIKKIVPWEDFRTDIEAVTETKPEERKS